MPERGTHQILFKNKKANLSFTLPVNPISIKWDGQLDIQRHDTKAGVHYQFIRYLRTNGRMSLNTGAARNIPFANEFFGRDNCTSAYEYLMRLGALIEYWSKEAVRRNVGPITMVDTAIPERPIIHDIIFTSFPGFGPEAAKTSFTIDLTFEIVNDYVDKYEMSEIKADVMPALARARDAVYTAKPGDTVESVAKQIYGNEAMGVLISRESKNDKYISGDGKIKPGSTIIVPYAPIPREDYIADRGAVEQNKKKDAATLSGPAGSMYNRVSEFGNWFDIYGPSSVKSTVDELDWGNWENGGAE